MMTHTPTPWAIDPLKQGILGDISTVDGAQCIAQAQQIYGDDRKQGTRTANAAFIVKAVNSYALMVEALRALITDAGWNSLTMDDLEHEKKHGNEQVLSTIAARNLLAELGE